MLPGLLWPWGLLSPVLGAAEAPMLPGMGVAAFNVLHHPAWRESSKTGEREKQGEGAGEKEGVQQCPDGSEGGEALPWSVLPCVASEENQKL